MSFTKTTSLALTCATLLLSSSFVFAGQQKPDVELSIALAEQPSGSALDSELTNVLLATLQADTKIKGVLHVSSRSGAVAVSGTVTSVAMIYRVVELVRDLPGVNSVDVTKLDT